MRQRASIRLNKVLKDEPIQNLVKPKKSAQKIKKIIWVLSIPLIIGIVTFILGMIFMATGSARTSQFVLYMSIISLLITTAAFIFAPSYIISILLYIYLVKKLNKDRFKALWFIPIIQALTSWFPSFLKVPASERTYSAFFGLMFITLLISTIWVGFIHLVYIFKFSKKNKSEKIHG